MNRLGADFDEREALIRSAQGDERAFKLIFEAYQPRVYTFALHYLKSSQHAEDAVQEVFLKLWRKGVTLIDIEDLEKFVFTITRNHALDRLRRNKVRERLQTQLPEDYEPATNETEESILLHETRRILMEGIEKLPPQQRKAYQFCHQEGLKYSEAAEKMGISEQTVHRHMKLALHFLREHLKKNGQMGIILLLLKFF